MKYLLALILTISCSQANEGFIDGLTAGIMNEPDIEQCVKDFPKLKTCDERLVDIACLLEMFIDIVVVTCHRGEAEQNQLVKEGKSKVKYPDSKHNSNPSKAIDIVTKPVDWEDREQFSYIAGTLKGMYYIRHKGHLRWGGDWNDNFIVKDNKFDDLIHFEVRE